MTNPNANATLEEGKGPELHLAAVRLLMQRASGRAYIDMRLFETLEAREHADRQEQEPSVLAIRLEEGEAIREARQAWRAARRDLSRWRIMPRCLGRHVAC